jgi:hypothetical protein
VLSFQMCHFHDALGDVEAEAEAAAAAIGAFSLPVPSKA